MLHIRCEIAVLTSRNVPLASLPVLDTTRRLPDNPGVLQSLTVYQAQARSCKRQVEAVTTGHTVLLMVKTPSTLRSQLEAATHLRHASAPDVRHDLLPIAPEPVTLSVIGCTWPTGGQRSGPTLVNKQHTCRSLPKSSRAPADSIVPWAL